jgi:hypothetical protein
MKKVSEDIPGCTGLAAGQVVRLTTTALPPDPCDAMLSFANAQGFPVGPSLTATPHEITLRC